MNYTRAATRLLFRMSHGCKTGAKTLIALFTICGTLFGLAEAAGLKIPIRYVFWSLIISILISVVYGASRAETDHLPDSVVLDDEIDKTYELRFESKDVCSEFNRTSAKYFGGDSVEDPIVESWRTKSPKAFVYLRNCRGDPCAALCIFSLKPSFMEQFIKGRVSESDIEPDDILELAASKRTDSLYLSAIIVNDPQTQVGHRRAVVMVWAVIQYLKKTFGTRKKKVIYAVPVNRPSENLLRRLGFQIVSRAATRKDKHDMYSFEMTAESLVSATNRVGDYSTCCRINLSDAQIRTNSSQSTRSLSHA
jgi:hypothetical protein